MNRNWMYVFIAGIFEVAWVAGLKYSHHWISWTGTIIAISISFYVLLRSTKSLPVSTVYAVFTGIGTMGTVLVEMIVFDEPFRWTKIFLIIVMLIGVFGLKMITTEDANKKGAAA